MHGIKNAVLIILLLFSIFGCRKKENLDDFIISGLRKEIIDNPKYSEGSKRLSMQAIQKWENNEIDNVPILIDTCLSSFEGKNESHLTLIFYDENKDVTGIIVEEYSNSPENNMPLVEQYPLYNFESFPYVVEFVWHEITFRSKGELKNEKAWSAFLSSEFSNASITPPVLISLPGKGTKVYITVYDRQGNKSNKVELIDGRK